MADANIRAVITAKDEASKTLKNFGDNASNLGRNLAIGFTAAGVAVTALGVSSIKAFEESENAIAQTNAVLASTKGIAGVTATQVDKLSKSLEKTTAFSDEQVRSAENMLLTFTRIGKDTFPHATEAVLDYSVALHKDVLSSSISVGKALNGMAGSMTALQKSGVGFSDAQKDVIQNLFDTGRAAEAQKIILAELDKEFGGSAKAARNTFAGSLKALGNSLNNVEELIGKLIANGLAPLITKISDFVTKFNWEQAFRKTIDVIREFYRQIADYLEPKIKALSNSLKDISPAFKTFLDQYVTPLVEALATAAGKSIVWAIGKVIDILNLLVTIANPIFKWLDSNKGIVYGFAGAFLFLKGTIMIWDIVDRLRLAFETLQLVTIPNTIASLSSLNTFLTGFGGWAVFAAAGVGAFIAIRQAAEDTKATLEDTKNHVISDYNSINNATSQLKTLLRTGTPEQKARAKKALEAGYASGTNYSKGGWSMVGESGPELVNLPTGSKVIPNNQIGGFGGNINININAGALMGTDIEARKFAQIILTNMKDLAGSKNMKLSDMIG